MRRLFNQIRFYTTLPFVVVLTKLTLLAAYCAGMKNRPVEYCDDYADQKEADRAVDWYEKALKDTLPYDALYVLIVAKERDENTPVVFTSNSSVHCVRFLCATVLDRAEEDIKRQEAAESN